MSQTEQILSQLPGNVLGRLRGADRLWQALREDTAPIPLGIKDSKEPLGIVDWDVVICGGTLGILISCALTQRGWRVALIERGILRGRDQEWNISRQELEVFLELGLLEEAQLEQAIANLNHKLTDFGLKVKNCSAPGGRLIQFSAVLS